MPGVGRKQGRTNFSLRDVMPGVSRKQGRTFFSLRDFMPWVGIGSRVELSSL